MTFLSCKLLVPAYPNKLEAARCCLHVIGRDDIRDLSCRCSCQTFATHRESAARDSQGILLRLSIARAAGVEELR